MKFTLEINLGNDAMNTGGDVARSLAALAKKIKVAYPYSMPRTAWTIMDDNGNSVGRAEVVK